MYQFVTIVYICVFYQVVTGNQWFIFLVYICNLCFYVVFGDRVGYNCNIDHLARKERKIAAPGNDLFCMRGKIRLIPFLQRMAHREKCYCPSLSYTLRNCRIVFIELRTG